MNMRPLEESDLKKVLEWRNDPMVRSYMYTNHEISWEEHVAWYKFLRDDKSKACYIFSNNDFDCGVINYTDINFRSRNAFWGFYAAPGSPAGTGLMMEYCALSYAFNELNLHKLNCEVIKFNKAVVNLHHKCGFEVEGEFRDFHFDGENFHDVIRMGILEEEWASARPLIEGRIKIR